MKKIFFTTFMLFVFTALAVSAAMAEEPAVVVEVKSRFITETDVSRQPGEIQISETDIDLGYDFKLDNGLPIELGVSHKHIEIDENVPVELPSHLEGTQFKIGTKFPMPFIDSDEMFMGVDLMPSFYTDDGAFESSAFRIPFRIYGIYKESDDLIFVAGASIRPDYDSGSLPIIGLIYKPNDELSFNLASDDPNITYKIADNTHLLWEFGYTLDEFEVTEMGRDGLILKYQSGHSGIGIKYQVDDHITASLSGGGIFGRRIEYEEPLGKLVPEGGAYVKAKVSLNF